MAAKGRHTVPGYLIVHTDIDHVLLSYEGYTFIMPLTTSHPVIGKFFTLLFRLYLPHT